MPGQRLLALFAHPDDEAFPVGGALAAHAARGVKIHLLTATSGEEGEIRQEGAATSETLGSIRRVELSCAVQALGLAGHRVLGYRDSGMAGTEPNNYPNAYINVPDEEMVEQLVEGGDGGGAGAPDLLLLAEAYVEEMLKHAQYRASGLLRAPWKSRSHSVASPS